MFYNPGDAKEIIMREPIIVLLSAVDREAVKSVAAYLNVSFTSFELCANLKMA